MPNSLLAGITGLVAHQRRLDVVANNLANINTTAYKSQTALFADLLYETVQPATNGSAISIGGSNPNQIGSGVTVSQVAKKMTQGNLEATGQQFDFAIQGEGFFVLNNGSENLFTRAGAFSLDERGNLVDPSTGYFVQRMGDFGEGDGVNPAFQTEGDTRINVPIGANLNGTTTSEVGMTGNLLANAVGPLQEVLTTASPFLSSGSPITTATLIDDLDSNTAGYVAPDTIEIGGINSDGTTFSASLSVTAVTTMGDLVAAINGAASDATASIDASGNVVFTADDDGAATLDLTLTDGATNTGGSDFNGHVLSLTTDGKLGDSFQSTMQVYDIQGGKHPVTLTFTKEADNAWKADFSVDSDEGTVIDGSVTGIRFNDDGSLRSAGETGIGDLNVEFRFNGISASQPIELDLSKITQFATEFDMTTEQDGRPPGKLIAIQISADGVIQGVSTSGDRVPIAQVALAKFRNPSGLDSSGGNFYRESLNSGEAQLGSGGNGGRGTMAGGQLEASNVDMALEFTQLIVAQRGFSANTRTITVSNEMLQELTNVIR